MKVIKEGRDLTKSPKEYICNCPDCDCEFSYVAEDIRAGVDPDILYVKCPNETCKRDIYV